MSASAPPILIIGNKNYSTWSMRPWVFMRAFGVAFEEQRVSLRAVFAGECRAAPTRQVPVLLDGDAVVWDSLAICEYVRERYLDGRGLPADVAARAKARALLCEMHAGFGQLRAAMPMNIRARRRVAIDAAVAKDLARVDEIWSAARGEWLFGDSFGLADGFFAPVAMRFATYADTGENLSPSAQSYWRRLQAHEAVQEWRAAALQEEEVISQDETGEEMTTQAAGE